MTSTASAQVVQDSLLAAAGIDARARYGVTNALDTMLFPRLGPESAGFVMDSIYAPGLLDYTQLVCSDGGPCQRPVDVVAGTFALSANGRRLGFYYASSLNYARLRTQSSAAVDPMISFLAPLTSTVIAPMSVGPTGFLATAEDGLLSSIAELSLGARVFVPVAGADTLTGTVGYYAAADRSGLYTSFSDEELQLVFTSLLTEDVPYLLGGFQRARWLWQSVSPLGERALASSVFVRKLSLQKSEDLLPSGSTLAASAPPLWTGHIEQFGLGPVDLQLAMAFRPSVLLHEARISYTRGTLHINAGGVQLPAAPWMLAEGGWYPTAQVALVAPEDLPELEGSRLSIELNTPETLTAFPYTRNAVICRMTVLTTGGDEP